MKIEQSSNEVLLTCLVDFSSRDRLDVGSVYCEGAWTCDKEKVELGTNIDMLLFGGIMTATALPKLPAPGELVSYYSSWG